VNILVDSNLYKKEEFGDSFDFMLAHGLIILKEYLLSYKVVFVGEVVTPHGYFISLPKNFTDTSSSNVKLVKSILKEFSSLTKSGKILIKNKSYEVGGEIDSDYYYWSKIYSYFTDYITYGFYYPKNRIIRHSLKRQQGRLNPMLTEVNRERTGSGLTYEVKDYSDNYFRNTFYSILKLLENQFASKHESEKINEIEKFLHNKEISFQIIEIDKQYFLNYAKNLQTNPIHDVIHKTLVNYFLSSKIKEKNTINAFYTQEFEYLYEYLLQKVLVHNVSYKNVNWLNPNFKNLQPDIIADSFIGDAKYYKVEDFSSKPFEKELYAYNVANGNSQPNFVFIPSEETRHLQTLVHNTFRLEVVSVDLKNILKDYHNKQFETLNFVKTLVAIIRNTCANNT
jgi:hypothetical protein